MFAAYLTTSSTSTESHYRPKKNTTIIMTKPQDLDDVDDDCDVRLVRVKIPGLVVPSIVTNQGDISVNY
jgi:hypothetical protein